MNFPQICLRLKEHTPIFVERASLFLKDLCIANRNTDMRGQDAQTLDVVRREGISTRTLDVQDTDHPVTCDKRQCQFRTGFGKTFGTAWRCIRIVGIVTAERHRFTDQRYLPDNSLRAYRQPVSALHQRLAYITSARGQVGKTLFSVIEKNLDVIETETIPDVTDYLLQ